MVINDLGHSRELPGPRDSSQPHLRQPSTQSCTRTRGGPSHHPWLRPTSSSLPGSSQHSPRRPRQSPQSWPWVHETRNRAEKMKWTVTAQATHSGHIRLSSQEWEGISNIPHCTPSALKTQLKTSSFPGPVPAVEPPEPEEGTSEELCRGGPWAGAAQSWHPAALPSVLPITGS